MTKVVRCWLALTILLITSVTGGYAQSTRYHYWFDGDFSNKVTVDGTLDAIDCSALSFGLHQISVFAEKDGEVTTPRTAWFMRGVIADENGNVDLLVFIDGEYHTTVKAKASGITPLDLDMLTLSKGTHTLQVTCATAEYVSPQVWETEFEAAGIADSGSLILAVSDKNGTDFTDRVSIEWYKDNELIASGAELTGVALGDTLRYKVVLPEELGLIYKDIRSGQFVVSAGSSFIAETLVPFEAVRVSGRVHTSDTAAEGVSVEIKQYPNDRFTTKTTVETAADGTFEIELIDAPTRFDFSGKGYIATYRVVESLTAENALPLDVEIEREGLGRIMLDLTYHSSSTDGPVESKTAALDGDINYTMLCDGLELLTGIYNGGGIPVPESVEPGSTLTVRVESANKLFDAAESSVVYDRPDSTSLSISVMERGGIESRFAGGFAPAYSVAYLYNADGRLMKSEAYKDAVAFTGLEDGSYIMVSLVNDGTLGVPASIDDFSTLGMKAGADYTLHRADVTSGTITVFELSQIPQPDMGMASVITSGTLFTASKSSVTAAEMVTANVKLNLSDDIVEKTSHAVLTISLPDNCAYEPGSMMINGKIAPSSVADGKISVRINKEDLASRIRFCLSSSAGGDFHVGASLALNMGSDIVCPIEPLFYHASDYDFYVPAKTPKSTIHVMGVAEKYGNVWIYDGDVMIGSTVADATGRWSADVELNNPRNTSSHNIWTRTANAEMKFFATQPKKCSYNDKYVVPKSVTMINTAHKVGNTTPVEFKTVFNLDEDRKVSSNYYFYMPTYPEFTFLIDFETNDPDQVSNVLLNVFTENDNSITLPADFDQFRQHWVCNYKFKPNDRPVNVSVDYSDNIIFEDNDKSNIEFDLFDDLEKYHDESVMVDSLKNELHKAWEVDDDYTFEVITSQLMRLLNYHIEDFNQDADITRFINECSALSPDEIQNQCDLEFPALNQDDNIPGMLDIRQLIAEITMPKDKTEETLSNGTKIELLPPVDGQLSSAYPKQITIENKDQIVNNSTNTAKLRFDNGYTMNIDITETKKAVTAIVDKPSENPFCIFARNIDSFGDFTQNEWLERIAALLSTCEMAADMAENYGKSHAERWLKWDRIYKRTKNSDNAAIRMLAKISRTERLNEFSKWAPIAENKKLIGLAQSLGNIAKAYDVSATIHGISEVANTVCNDWQSWDGLIALAHLKCSPEIRDAFLAEIHNQQDNHRRDLLACAIPSIAFSIGSFAGGQAKHPIISFGTGQGCALVSELFNNGYTRVNSHYQDIRFDIRNRLLKHQECEDDPDDKRPPYPPYPRNDADPIEDPSGFVYEGVVSMPVEGVTATIYRNDTTEGEGEPWVADEYGQVNPQLTDAMGMYGWDVPRGNYRVVFEKEGYEPAMTEWLPVPPPQLDVNVSMRKTAPAELKSATATREYISIEFDTYMDASTLTSSNIYFEADGRKVDATIELVNAEGAAPDAVLASKVRVVPAMAVDAPEVTLHIGSGVATYAGVSLPEEIVRTLPVEDAVADLVAPAEFAVEYGSESTLRVRLLPASAAAGRKLHIVPSSSVIIGVSATEVAFDQDGYASVDIAGLLPGNAALTLTVDGYDAAVVSRITVGTTPATDVAAPEASVPSGSEVSRGSVVSLTCATPDAVIYYTTDGSCPCDPSSTRRVFDSGSPIVIDATVTIKAMAAVGAMESAIATFTYKVVTPPTILGIDGPEADGTKIYPVPVSDRLHVELPTASEASTVRVTLTNSAGAAVVADECRGGSFTVNVGHLPSGVYIIMLDYGDGRTESRRVIKR